MMRHLLIALGIAAALSAEAGAVLGAPAIVDAPAITASPSSERVEPLLLEKLRSRYPDVERWEIRPFGNENAAPAVTDDISVVRLGPRSAVQAGTHTYWYAVTGLQKVVSLTHRVATGGGLDSRMARVEQRDVLAVNCTPLTETAALNGSRATKTLRENDILCANSIEPRPPVVRGESVTVKYVGAHIVLTTKAVAQADGRVGDTLRVRSARDADEFTALVSGAGEVTINE